jgi:hypothetical protein
LQRILTRATDLVDRLGLLHLGLEQLLHRMLHNLAALLQGAREGGKRLFQLTLHLGSHALVLLGYCLELAAHGIERRLQGAHLLRPQRLAAE